MKLRSPLGLPGPLPGASEAAPAWPSASEAYQRGALALPPSAGSRGGGAIRSCYCRCVQVSRGGDTVAVGAHPGREWHRVSG
jgi:hypothetical protein